MRCLPKKTSVLLDCCVVGYAQNVPSMLSQLLAPDLACDKGVSEVAGNMFFFFFLLHSRASDQALSVIEV